MKIKIFGYTFSVSHNEDNSLSKQGSAAKIDNSLTAIKSALDTIENRGLKYSEYRVQKLSGLSINTVKKYRIEIAEYRAKISRALI